MIYFHSSLTRLNSSDESIDLMVRYMADRARFLYSEIRYADSISDHFELIGCTEPEKRTELARIISILKGAGVHPVIDDK